MTATKDQTFARVEKLVYSQAHAYCRSRPHADRAEVLSEATYAYAQTITDYDPAKAALTTYVHRQVDYALRDYTQKQKRRKPARLAAEPAVKDRPPFDPTDLLHDLRKDAADIVRLLLDSPGEMWAAVVTTKTGRHTPGGCRNRLAKVLEGRGWPLATVKAAFKEIGEAIRCG